MKLLYQKQLNQELSMLQQQKTKKKGNALNGLEPKILNANGNINWWWVVTNIGKIIARIIFAIEEGKK